MSESVLITILVENSVNIGGLRAEHGLAILVRVGGQKLLFDTGQSDLALSNARAMGLSLENLDAIVLSHGHYDHSGGLRAVCQIAPRARVVLHPEALADKFSGTPDGTSRFIGMPSPCATLVRESDRSVTWTTKPAEVLPGVFVTGEVPRTNHFEDTGGRFFLDSTRTQCDPLTDDQALYFDTPEGTVVLLGCAHAGVVNTVEYIRQLTKNRPIHALIGGLHLHSATPERILKTLEALRRWEVQRLAPGHCTGAASTARLWQEFPGRCLSCSVGTTIQFTK